MQPHNTESISNEQLEQIIYSLFRLESTNEFKRMVINTVYCTIEENKGITLNVLKRKLCSLLGFDESDVDASVVVLTHPNVFGCVSKFEVEKVKAKEKPVHLRTKNSGTEFWKYWIRNSDYIIKNNVSRILVRS